MRAQVLYDPLRRRLRTCVQVTYALLYKYAYDVYGKFMRTSESCDRARATHARTPQQKFDISIQPRLSNKATQHNATQHKITRPHETTHAPLLLSAVYAS